MLAPLKDRSQIEREPAITPDERMPDWKRPTRH